MDAANRDQDRKVHTGQEGAARHDSMLGPLRYPVFRRVWAASLLSNFGGLIQGVAAAWLMTELTSKAGMVALVQTAIMAPMLVLALPAGAIADMYDRRKVALLALAVAFVASVALSCASYIGHVTPTILLSACVFIGAAGSFLAPAWQASVSEQVPPASLGSAIALNSISFNVARSFGPALGGAIVATAGGAAAFSTTAIFYLPLFYALLRWNRVSEPARLPHENLWRAIISGVRYVTHSPTIRTVTLRTLLIAGLGAAIPALTPIIARDVLHGDARTFGMLVGAFGAGAVAGALAISHLRRRFSIDAVVSGAALLLGVGALGVSFSSVLPVSLLMLFVAGGGWMLSINEYNLAIQSSAPRWVTGRALAIFQAGVAGGMAGGAWVWGQAAQEFGVAAALKVAALGVLLLPIITWTWRLGGRETSNAEALSSPSEPTVALALTHRSGPVRIELEYRVPAGRARAFYGIMQDIRRVRSRTGGYEWSLARDVADPERWLESYSCPTWLDYLRQRTRLTEPERELVAAALVLLQPNSRVGVRRWLVRPYGSVRRHDDTPEQQPPAVAPL